MKIARERIIAEGERDDGPWLVMLPDGEVRDFVTRRAAERWIRGRAKKVVDRDGALVTITEWRYRKGAGVA